MARINKKIKDLIGEWEDAEAEVDYLEHKMNKIASELASLGMSSKQLRDRGIDSYYAERRERIRKQILEGPIHPLLVNNIKNV